MVNYQLIHSLNNHFQAQLPANISQEELLQKLSEFINHLIQKDFEKLVSILYKADVSENKLKHLLQQNSHNDAAPIIAKLLIEREEQKIYSRNQFINKEDIAGEEKW